MVGTMKEILTFFNLLYNGYELKYGLYYIQNK